MRHSNEPPTTTGKSVSIIQPPAERSSVRPWPSPCPPDIVLLKRDVKRGCWRFSLGGSTRPNQIAGASLGSLIPQHDVVVGRPPFVTVALDFHHCSRMVLQPLCVAVQCLHSGI